MSRAISKERVPWRCSIQNEGVTRSFGSRPSLIDLADQRFNFRSDNVSGTRRHEEVDARFLAAIPFNETPRSTSQNQVGLFVLP